MKYTRSETNEVIEVKGCTTCPHKVDGSVDLQSVMFCCVPTLRADGKYKPTNRKLIGRWEGPYHATCPLATKPENVPALEVKK